MSTTINLMTRVAYEYMDGKRKDESNITLWDVNNSCTAAVKKLKSPGAAFAANVKLGKFFALGNRQRIEEAVVVDLSQSA